MPVETSIIQKYYSQLKNGVGFTINGSDVTANLVGSVGERIKVETTISILSHAISNPDPWALGSPGSGIFSYNETDFSLTRNTGNFITDGLSAGDTVDLFYMDNLTGVIYLSYLATIASIQSATKLYFISNPAPLVPVDPAHTYLRTGAYYYMDVRISSWFTSLNFNFGLIGNVDNFNNVSKVSLNGQCFYNESDLIGGNDGGGGRLTNDVVLQKLGNYSDWITGSCSCAYVSTSNCTQVFKITHQFIITPYFIKEWKQNLIDGTAPDLFTGTNTIKYAINPVFATDKYKLLTDPKSAISTINLGCVGFFNSNFVGFNNKYAVKSIVYTDTGTGGSADGLQIGSNTTVVITITKTGGFKNSGEAFGVMCSFCPDDTVEYQDTITTLEQNFLYDNAINSEGAATVAGANGIIKTCTAAIASTELVITTTIEYTAAQQLLLQNSAKYLIGVLVSSDKTDTPALVNIPAGSADKVMLLADYTDYVLSADIPDLMGIDTFTITRHDNITGTQFTLWNEDGINMNMGFWLDTAKSALLKSLDMALVAYKYADETYFILDKKGLNVASMPVVSGIQQLNINTNRGYKLSTSDIQNQILLTTGALVSTKQYYNLSIGQKIKWQDWIKNTLADTAFYDITKTNNNLNYKSSNYGSIEAPASGYSIRLMLIANVYGTNVLGISGYTIYNLISPEQFIYDYSKPTYWTCSIETFDETGTTNLSGAIRYDANTLMKVTWTYSGTIYPYYNIWNIHRIEESQESGDSIYEHSTLVDRIATAPFAEQTGATTLRLKQTIDLIASTVITEDLIDFTKLDSEKSYKISARINYDKLSITSDAIITEDNIIMISETSDILIVEP